MYGIFAKPLKKAFQTCMGHGGVGGRKKKLPEAKRPRVRDFQPISSRHGQNLTRLRSFFQKWRLGGCARCAQ